MQYQKQEVRQRILAAGRQEYLEKGYKNGKISVIAEKAGVPVGNLYRYFDGKSGVFEAIVSEAYTEVPVYIESVAEQSSKKGLTLTNAAGVLTATILHLLDRCGTEIMILMDMSEGSRFADFGQNLRELVYKYLNQNIFKCKTKQDEVFCSVISKAFLDMIFDILRKGNRQNYGELIDRMLKFFFFQAENRI